MDDSTVFKYRAEITERLMEMFRELARTNLTEPEVELLMFVTNILTQTRA